MRYFVTGCAGFIGSHVTDRLLALGHVVIGYDNLSTGFKTFLQDALTSPNFTFIEGDLLDKAKLIEHMPSVDVVFHLAANADVRYGTDHTHKDLEQNTIVTFNVLEAMRHKQNKKIVFSSTGSIYGDAEVIPTPEHAPFPVQTSLYGASKLAAEGLIQAYCEGFDFQSYIFRFVSILGERYSHGHVFDFYRQLKNDSRKLSVLGNGKQRKSYLYVHDCIDAIFAALKHANNKVNIFNLGTDEYCEVNHSIDWICQFLNVSPDKQYAGGDKGWIGDNPFIYLDCQKIRALGWQPNLSIQAAITKTIAYLTENHWVMESRV